MLSYKEFRLNEAKLNKIEKLKSTLNITKEYSDGSIDVEGNIVFYSLGLTKIPFKFNKVNGDFDCARNKINSLVGAPRECISFSCAENKLKSLKGGPLKVSYYWCNHTELESLEGAPDNCIDFYCNDNKLKNLIGGPSRVRDIYRCVNNKLESLEGAPTECKAFHFSGSLDLLKTIANKEYLNFFNTAYITCNFNQVPIEYIKTLILTIKDPSNKEFYDKAKVLDLF